MNEITVETMVAGQLTNGSAPISPAVNAADPKTAGMANRN